MFKFALPLLFIASFAQAHIEPGTYTGSTSDKSVCSMVVKSQHFENGFPHPLNERILLEVNGTAFAVGHPPVIDVKNEIAYFNHDVFQGIVATPTGAIALEIAMNHSEGAEGPLSFTLVENKWKTSEKSSIVCENLVYSAK